MADARKIIVIFVIAVIFAIFANSAIEAIIPVPKYEEYCKTQYEPKSYPLISDQNNNCTRFVIPNNLSDSCQPKDGYIAYKYDNYGCITDAYCDSCNIIFDKENQKYNLFVFFSLSIIGIAAIAFGLVMPMSNPINEWVGSGFILGGLLSIFIGTARYYGDMARFARPIVMLLELILVIYLTYRKLGKK
ncbi:MAG: hypothetical protein V1859_04165 [archaeon]